MNAQTVILRDLRRLARHSYTFWGRAVFGILAFCGLWGTALAVDLGFVTGLNKGKAIFWLLSQLLLFLCAIVGVITTSDSLSEERREGTLGLLFLTPLRPLALLFGRLVSASVTLVYRFLGVIPVIGLTMIFGGVAPGEFVRLALLLGNALLLSLAIGLFVSCVATAPRVALTSSFFLTGLIYLGPFFFWGVTGMLGHRYTVGDLFPVLSLSPIFGLAYSGCLHPWAYDPSYFTWSVGTSHALSWVLFWGGAVFLKRSVRSEKSAVGVRRWRKEKGQKPSLVVPKRAQVRLRKRLLDSAPYSWLMARHGNAKARVEGYLVALFLIGAVSWWRVPEFQGFAVFLLCFAVAFVKVWFLIETVTRISDERSKGSFELLLSSPLGVSGILRGINKALWRQFGRGLIGLVALAGWLYHSLDHSSSRELERDYQAAFWPVAIGVLVDLWALKWSGMWSAMKSKGNSRAYLAPIAVIFLVPWLASFFVGGGINFYRGVLRISDDLAFSQLIAIWAWCSFPLVIAYGWRARYQVTHRTWSMATHGFDYGSAESEWMLTGSSSPNRRMALWSRIPWPKTFRRRVWASCGVIVLSLILFGQGRRIYFERQFRHSMATFSVPQESMPQNAQGFYTPKLGSIPSSLYDAAAMCVSPSVVVSADIKAIEPAVARSPNWEKSFSLTKRLEVLEQIRQRNGRALSRILLDAPISTDLASSDLRDFRSWSEAQILFTAFDVIGCEIYHRVLQKDLEPATRALISAARIHGYLADQEGSAYYFTINAGIGTRLDPWLRLLLSTGALSDRELSELETILLRIEGKSARKQSMTMRMRYLAAYSEFDFLAISIPCGPGLARKANSE